MAAVSREITERLHDWSAGETAALEELMPLVVDDLRRLAIRYFQGEGAAHTLQPTALVNEVCLRLMDWRRVQWDNRRQFFAFAGKLMRRLLVDYARRRRAEKRGGGIEVASLTTAVVVPQRPPLDVATMLDLNRALERLEAIDPDASLLVELRFFAGLSIAETARALEVSPATVKREWKVVKQWLAKEMGAPPAADQLDASLA